MCHFISRPVGGCSVNNFVITALASGDVGFLNTLIRQIAN
jgi:hypothetical protein